MKCWKAIKRYIHTEILGERCAKCRHFNILGYCHKIDAEPNALNWCKYYREDLEGKSK